MTACAGDCCVAFPVSTSLARLWVDQRAESLDLLAMLVPLSTEEAVERRARFGVDLPIDPERAHYSCVHWDEDTRLCGNYENRPRMCRYYPYGRPCEHGCACHHAYMPKLWEGDQA